MKSSALSDVFGGGGDWDDTRDDRPPEIDLVSLPRTPPGGLRAPTTHQLHTKRTPLPPAPPIIVFVILMTR